MGVFFFSAEWFLRSHPYSTIATDTFCSTIIDWRRDERSRVPHTTNARRPPEDNSHRLREPPPWTRRQRISWPFMVIRYLGNSVDVGSPGCIVGNDEQMLYAANRSICTCTVNTTPFMNQGNCDGNGDFKNPFF